MTSEQFRQRVLQRWKQQDPYLEDVQGFREYFNEQFHKRFAEEEKKRTRPNWWMERLRELDSTTMAKRLEYRIHDKILVAGEDYHEDRKDEFKEGIELLGELMEIHSEFTKRRGKFLDMFGEYLIEHGRLNSKTGEFFTPYTVVEAMVKMTFTTHESLEGEPKRVLDPCGGTGRFMLKTAEHYLETIGKINFIFYNVDIGFRMYVFCTMNAILNGIPSVNVWGNSLSCEYWEGVVTIPIGNVSMWKRLDKEQATNCFVERR